MIPRIAFALLFLFSGLSFAADKDFNGRWDITVNEQAKKRAWWLEIAGAGSPSPSGSFVGAPGGQLDKIPELKIEKGELRFTFKGNYDPKPAPPRTGIYTARIEDGKLHGTFVLEGNNNPVTWVGVRAPKLTAPNPKKLREGEKVELFNGHDLSGWSPLVEGRKSTWVVENGIMKNSLGASDLVTSQKFWNFKLHAEYRYGPNSNSGIGLRGRYEIQIYDDNGKEPSLHGNGALYSRIAPAVNASKPAGEWQTLDITLIGNQLTVILNEAKIIDKKEIEGLTAIATDPNEAEPGPIVIQGDHGVVEFRKLTLTALEKK
jgi:hypothetical protein